MTDGSEIFKLRNLEISPLRPIPLYGRPCVRERATDWRHCSQGPQIPQPIETLGWKRGPAQGD